MRQPKPDSGEVVQARALFSKHPGPLQAAPLLAWSGWSMWSNLFQRSVNQNKGVNRMNTHTTAVAELAKNLSPVGHAGPSQCLCGFQPVQPFFETS